jgi:hypothetical protein
MRDRQTNGSHSLDELPQVLYEDIINRRCVLFVGAGVTTEARYLKPSFYEMIKRKSGYPDGGEPPVFHELMQYFCDHMDGSQRNRLIREAIHRIESFCAPDENHTLATGFAVTLARIPFFDRFITTNWDPFLERSLGVLVPMVEDSDLAFWDDSKKQVLKVHGCITRPSTLVATSEDYKAWMKRNPFILNKLKDLATTRTVVFVGYSVRDPDLIAVFNELSLVLGDVRKLAFSVEPDPSEERITSLKLRGVRVVRQMGIAFAQDICSKLESDGLIASEGLLESFARERERIAALHFALDQDTDWGMASAMYQDGLLHALDEVSGQSALGREMSAFRAELADCEKNLAQMRKKDNIIEIAYLSGWCEVLTRLCNGSASALPAFFHPQKLVPAAKAE